MKTILTRAVVLLALLLSAIPVLAQENIDNKAEFADSSELFLGQKPPGKRAEIYAPEVLAFECHDSPIISQDETCIIIFSMEEGVKFYKMINGSLLVTTNPLNFDIPRNFNGMAISISENRVYFLLWENDDENFYYIEKHKNYWTPPKSLGEEINSFKTHWQFSVANNENLYFSSGGILVSVFDGDSHLKPVPLKLEDDSNLPAATPFISPDESYIIYSMDEDLHISYNLRNGKWTTPQNLGTDINSDYLELCPRISPNGKYMFFISRRIGQDFVTYWADAGFI